MKPSKYQEAIYSNQVTTNKNMLIKAAPGSGKSTTLVEASKLIPYGKKAIFIAFNKSIVEELKHKLPSNVLCSTMHSLGCRAIFSHYLGEKKIDDKKQMQFIIPLFSSEQWLNKQKEKWASIYQIDRLMRLARATMSPITTNGFIALCDTYALDITQDNIEVGIKALNKFNEYNQNEKRNIMIDFQDMVSMPVLNREIRMPQFDYVYVDEAQDCSTLDQMLIERVIKPNVGRLIVCGDENQSIYNFRGADPNSFNNFLKRPNTIQLPLSISYRCSKAIVRKAKEVYQDIEENESNVEGIVRNGKLEQVKEGDMVLCRNSRPLVFAYLEIIRQGKKATIVGKEIEKGLLALLSPYDGEMSSKEVSKVLNSNVLEKLTKELNGRGVQNCTTHPRFIEAQEKLQILHLLLGKFENVARVEQFIEQIFNDEQRDGVQLMTIHKSKGLECDTVFVIEKFEGQTLLPSKWAVTADMIKAEKNLRFVSYTRAKKELVILNL